MSGTHCPKTYQQLAIGATGKKGEKAGHRSARFARPVWFVRSFPHYGTWYQAKLLLSFTRRKTFSSQEKLKKKNTE